MFFFYDLRIKKPSEDAASTRQKKTGVIHKTVISMHPSSRSKTDKPSFSEPIPAQTQFVAFTTNTPQPHVHTKSISNDYTQDSHIWTADMNELHFQRRQLASMVEHPSTSWHARNGMQMLYQEQVTMCPDPYVRRIATATSSNVCVDQRSATTDLYTSNC